MNFTSDDAFNAVLYGQAGMVNFAKPVYNNIFNDIKGVASDMFKRGQQLYDKYTSNSFFDAARSAINKTLGITNNIDTIQAYSVSLPLKGHHGAGLPLCVYLLRGLAGHM